MKRTFQGIFLFIASKMHCRSLSQRRSGQRNLTKCKSRPSICTRQIISIHISLWQIHSYLGKILQLGKALSPNALARPKAWSWLKRITALLSIGSWSRRMPFNASSLLIAAGPWRQVKWAGRMFRYRETFDCYILLLKFRLHMQPPTPVQERCCSHSSIPILYDICVLYS